jgi:pilus assembly protein Flp/PilA
VLARFIQDDSGATAIEYGLIAVATGLALVAAMPSLNSNVSGMFTSIKDGLSTAMQ